MQHVDRPAHVQALSQPPRACRPRMNPEPLCSVLRPQRPHRIGRHRRRRRHLGQQPAVRPAELQRPVGHSFEADSPPRAPPGDGGDTVTPGSTASSGRPAPSGARDAPGRTGRCTPGSDSSGLDAAAPAAAPGEPCASGLRPPRSAPPRRAASPPGSRRTPVAATFPRERGSPLPARIGRVVRLRQHGSVHVDDHLVPLTRGPGIELLMQRCLGQQG